MFFTGLANDLQGIDKKTRRPTKLISQGKQVGYFYDKHGRVKTKTLTPVDKDGEPLRDFFRICVTAIKVKDKVQLYHRIQS